MELLFPPEHLDQVDEVWVLQVLQHLDLAHGDLLDHRIILRFLAAIRGIILSLGVGKGTTQFSYIIHQS